MTHKTLAFILLAVGLILLFFAYQSSQSLGDQVTEAFTGRFTDGTTWLVLFGAAAAVGGFGMLVFGGTGSTHRRP